MKGSRSQTRSPNDAFDETLLQIASFVTHVRPLVRHELIVSHGSI